MRPFTPRIGMPWRRWRPLTQRPGSVVPPTRSADGEPESCLETRTDVELVEISLRHGTQSGEVKLQVPKGATMLDVKDEIDSGEDVA